jgi:hypothetical protein
MLTRIVCPNCEHIGATAASLPRVLICSQCGHGAFIKSGRARSPSLTPDEHAPRRAAWERYEGRTPDSCGAEQGPARVRAVHPTTSPQTTRATHPASSFSRLSERVGLPQRLRAHAARSGPRARGTRQATSDTTQELNAGFSETRVFFVRLRQVDRALVGMLT